MNVATHILRNSPGMMERADRLLLPRVRCCIKSTGDNFEQNCKYTFVNIQVKLKIFSFFFTFSNIHINFQS